MKVVILIVNKAVSIKLVFAQILIIISRSLFSNTNLVHDKTSF